jgi:SAM-dependent methyltransferase
LTSQSRGFDVGCGSGRWARFVAPRVAELNCIDASTEALEVAKRNLADLGNCHFHLASIDDMPLPPGSMDFGYSLGVLHHVPDASAGLTACVEKLKPGAPFLLYLYYAFDNRPLWFRSLWRVSDLLFTPALLIEVRRNLPDRGRYLFSSLARVARVVERVGGCGGLARSLITEIRSFYTMRTDAFDRFGTSLERFTRHERGDDGEVRTRTNCIVAQAAALVCRRLSPAC